METGGETGAQQRPQAESSRLQRSAGRRCGDGLTREGARGVAEKSTDALVAGDRRQREDVRLQPGNNAKTHVTRSPPRRGVANAAEYSTGEVTILVTHPNLYLDADFSSNE